jgi:transcriptional regulator with XRE-family HTH domain
VITVRGLSRADFPGIHEKTIARIERGEVERPHGGTLDAIAKWLGVAPEEIETY